MTTTAAFLGQYARELREQGIDEDSVRRLTRDAGRRLHADEGVSLNSTPRRTFTAATEYGDVLIDIYDDGAQLRFRDAGRWLFPIDLAEVAEGVAA